MIAERQRAVADDLPGLVALARDQEHIARFELLDRNADGVGAVTDLPRPLGRVQDRGTYCFGIFAARIVVGDDDAVGTLGSDRAHDRPLACIPIAAGAE